MINKDNIFNLVGNIAKINEEKVQVNGIKYKYITICQNTIFKDKLGNEVYKPNYYDIKVYEKRFDKFKDLDVGNFVSIVGRLNIYKNKENRTVISLVGMDSKILQKHVVNDEFDFDWLG